MKRRMIALAMAGLLAASLAACGTNTSTGSSAAENSAMGENGGMQQETVETSTVVSNQNYDKDEIEKTLNLANNEDQEWTYSSDQDAWTLSVVTAVAYPEIAEYQGVSVCVPGAYVKGIDTDKDGKEDVTASDASEAVKGALVIDYDAKVTSTNGQVYTAATAPVILNTGAAGYSAQANQTAQATYAAEGYINIACGNRGKQSVATLEDGTTYYTGDAPCCLVDQKNATRFVKYNILLGNLPGSTDCFVSTGGSGGGAHATMFAATSNNPDFYDYEIAAGAVGVYKDGESYSTKVTVNGKDVEISDGAWGCMAYSAITSLAEADMDMAFEYYMDTTYDFNTSFQKQMAQYLSEEYMTYINEQKLSVKESDVGFDINGDYDTEDTVNLTIEYDKEEYADTNGYGGTYLNLYLGEFQQNLASYLDNLDYASDWTWFDEDGNKLSDEKVAALSSADKVQAFIEGRYAKGSSDSGMGGGMAMGGGPGMQGGKMPDGNFPGKGQKPDGNGPGNGQMPGQGNDAQNSDSSKSENSDSSAADENSNSASKDTSGQTEEVGTPDAGTTQSASSGTDSANYTSFDDMVSAYESDIAEVEAGDSYGNNIVELYNPLNYIGNKNTDGPTWSRILMGASEGDMSMFASLNLQIAWLNAGTDAEIEWQWDGGHVPSEILGDSFALYVDEMYGKYVDGAKEVTKPEPEAVTKNGDADEASGTDLSEWVTIDESGLPTFTLAAAAAYRTAGASKAIPGFDVMDYGQEDYVFGDSDSDARHWNKYVLKVFKEHADTLKELFNQ